MSKNVFQVDFPWKFNYNSGDKVVCNLVEDRYNHIFLYLAGHVIGSFYDNFDNRSLRILKTINLNFPDFVVIKILSQENGFLTYSFDCLDDDLNVIKKQDDYRTVTSNRFLGKASKSVSVGETFYVQHYFSDSDSVYSIARQKFDRYIFLDCFRDDIDSNIFVLKEYSDEKRTITIREVLADNFLIYSINELDENCKSEAVKNHFEQDTNSKNLFTINSSYGFSFNIGDKIVGELREFTGDEYKHHQCLVVDKDCFPIETDVFEKIRSSFPDFVVINVLGFDCIEDKDDNGDVYQLYHVLKFSFDCLDDEGNIVKTPSDYRTGQNRFLGKIIDRDYEVQVGNKFQLYSYQDIDYAVYNENHGSCIKIDFYSDGFNIFVQKEHFEQNRHCAIGETITILEILDEGYVVYSIDGWECSIDEVRQKDIKNPPNDQIVEKDGKNEEFHEQAITNNVNCHISTEHICQLESVDTNESPDIVEEILENTNIDSSVDGLNENNTLSDTVIENEEIEKDEIMSKNIFVVNFAYNLPFPLYPNDKVVCRFIGASNPTRLAIHAYDFEVDGEIVKKIQKSSPDFCIIKIINFENHILTFSFDCLDDNCNIIRTQSDYENNKNRFLGITNGDVYIGQKLEYFDDSAIGENTKTRIYSGFYRDDCNVFIEKDAENRVFDITVDEVLDNGYVIFSIDSFKDDLTENSNSETFEHIATSQTMFPLTELAEMVDDWTISELAKFEQDRESFHLQDIVFDITTDSSQSNILMRKTTVRFFDKKFISQVEFSTAIRNAVFKYFEFNQNKTNENYSKFIDAILDLNNFAN